MKKISLCLLMAGVASMSFAQFTITVDTLTKYQVFKGFGAAHPTGTVAETSRMRQEFDNFGHVNVRFGLFSDSNFIKSKAELDAGTYDFTQSEMYKNALYLKEAKKWGMNRAVIEVFSPPGWMKSGGKSLCFPCTDAENYLLPAHYSDFAKWLGIEVKEVIKITGDIDFCLSIQNEPRFQEEWTKCVYRPGQYADALKVVGDYFQTNDTLKKVFLFGPTDMGLWGTQVPWMDTLLTVKPDAGAYLKGWGNQGYMDGVNPNIGDSSGWTAFAKKIIDQNNKELWMSSGDCSGYLNYLDAFNVAKHIHFALKDGRVSCFHYWQIAMFFDGAWLGMRGQLAKQYYRFIRPGYRQFSLDEDEKDFLAMGFKQNNNVTICCLNDNAAVEKSFVLDKAIAPFYHVYSMDNSEQMCIYRGKERSNSFVVRPKGLLTLYYNADDTDAVFAPLPVSVKATEINETSVTISWGQSAKWALKGTTGSYDINIKPGYKVMKNHIQSTIKTTTDTTYTFTGLTACTKYDFTVFITDSLNNTAYSTVSVTTGGTGCNTESLSRVSDEAEIYPNPASESITIDNPEQLLGGTIQITDNTGSIVVSRIFSNPVQDISSLPVGYYLIKVVSENRIITGRFVKQ